MSRGAALAAALLLFPAALRANGIFRNGVGARSMGLGGAFAALAEGPLGAMAANPAGLGFLDAPGLDVGLTAGAASGRFGNAATSDGRLNSSPGFVPDAAFAMPFGPDRRFGVGAAFVPESLLAARWRYVDAPGGADGVTSYGLQKHNAEIAVARTSLGLGAYLGRGFSIGAGAGLVYNENTLQSPYIFQSQPALKSLKVLLDLRTRGFGWNGNAGVLFRAERARAGLSYAGKTVVHGKGDVFADASAQLRSLGGAFASTDPLLHYDAEVVTVFPARVEGGAAVQVSRRCLVAVQADFINWSRAFDRLHIKLTNGSNAAVNGLVGSADAEDFVPMRWKDRVVYRSGMEYAVTERALLRAGWAYGKSPVPDDTLTPLTAAVLEHSLSAGLGLRGSGVRWDFAYQADLPRTRRVGASRLQAGEYSGTKVRAAVHWLALTVSTVF